MDTLTLRTIAAFWLRYDRICDLVTFERGPNEGDRPDVYGINRSRHGVEIEIKVSLADFKRDARKRKWDYQMVTPMFFYYMVPREMVEKVKPLVPPGVGLLTVARYATNLYSLLPEIQVEIRPTRNPKAKKLSVRHALKMVKHQSGTLCSLAVTQVNLHRQITQSKDVQ